MYMYLYFNMIKDKIFVPSGARWSLTNSFTVHMILMGHDGHLHCTLPIKVCIIFTDSNKTGTIYYTSSTNYILLLNNYR